MKKDNEFIEQQEMIASLLLLMTFEKEVPCAEARNVMREAVQVAYAQKGESFEIRDVVNALTHIENKGKHGSEANEVEFYATNLVSRLKVFLKSSVSDFSFKNSIAVNFSMKPDMFIDADQLDEQTKAMLFLYLKEKLPA